MAATCLLNRTEDANEWGSGPGVGSSVFGPPEEQKASWLGDVQR